MAPNGVSSWFSPLMMKMTETVSSLSDERTMAVKDVLAWLLAYHTASFDLKGRYLPHEVISWLINDISKDLFKGEEKYDEKDQNRDV